MRAALISIGGAASAVLCGSVRFCAVLHGGEYRFLAVVGSRFGWRRHGHPPTAVATGGETTGEGIERRAAERAAGAGGCALAVVLLAVALLAVALLAVALLAGSLAVSLLAGSLLAV
ncbi:unnamed protein product [Closterium sp. Naga37s-1]|nr:unnamed protein product [Closterium sp. Naga37s-1]